MVTRISKTKRVKKTWRELGEILSKAGVLHPKAEITNLTLAKPRVLLIDTQIS